MKKKENKIVKLFNSYKAVCAVLIVLCVFLLIFNMYTVKSNKVYVFVGYSDGITILDGTIYTGLKVHRFAAPNIIYTGEDVILKDYEIGYYINNDEISVVKTREEDTQMKLSDILKNADFSFTERHNGAGYFSKDNIKNIDKLEFRVKGTNQKNESISIKVELDIKIIS